MAARRAVRKSSRKSQKPKRKSTGKRIELRPTMSLQKTLSAAKNKEIATTVSFLFKHLQRNIRDKNRKDALNTHSCILGIAFLPTLPDKATANIVAHASRIAKKYRLASDRTIEVPNAHCTRHVGTTKVCREHPTKTCIAYYVGNNYKGCWNKI